MSLAFVELGILSRLLAEAEAAALSPESCTGQQQQQSPGGGTQQAGLGASLRPFLFYAPLFLCLPMVCLELP